MPLFISTLNHVTTMFPITGKLSDGREFAVIRKLKTKDVINARRIVQDKEDAFELGIALLAQIITIGGKGVVFEDLKELDLDDFTKIQSASGESLNFT